jgi:two-component sensor histidine kinase
VQLRLKQAVLDLLTDRAAKADHEWKKLADPVFRLAISNALYNYIEKSIVAHHEETINARKDERNQVIRDLAHSVKNLVATVVGPLDQLSKELPERRVILEKALRGARLIREVVNAVNLSSSGSLRDFANDAESAVSVEGTSISEIIMLAIESSVENMFDGKYFPEFVRKYFPSNIYNEAYSKWQEAKNSGGANINEFLNQYMFTLSVNIDNLAECRIADKLGSRTKCLILFQEIILNAVKYTAFANRQNRFIEIILEGHEKDSIHLRVKNSRHAGTNIKTSRIGRDVINNFTELLRGEIKVKESDDLYEVNLTFPNIFNPAIRGGILKEAKKP